MDRRSRKSGLAGLAVSGLVLGGAFPAFAQAPGRGPGPTARPAAAQTPSVLQLKVQGPTPDSAVIDFHTKIGSFKILSNSQDVKARGKLDMEFQGTVLVIGLEGTATPNGALKVQYDDQTHGRKAFFGQGRLTVEGKWRAIQFFGRNVKATWDGMGVLRVNGEFDDKLDTGSYQIRGYGGKEAWGNGGREVRIPPPSSAPRVKPKIVDVPTNPKLPS